MSQAGYTPISLYYSTTAAATPSAGNLVAGELALNTVDEKLYFKNSAGTVKLLASNATSAPVTTFSAGSTGLTPNSATAGAVTLAGTLAVANGGTGITSFGTGVATALGVNTGSAGAFVVNGGALGTPASGTVTNLTGTASININGTVGATTATTGAFTTLSASGDATIHSGTTGLRVLTIGGSPADNGYININLLSSNTQYNWQISENSFGNGNFYITPSTVAGNSVFTTPVFTLSSTGLNSTVIGATTPAAGSFTTLGASGLVTSNAATVGSFSAYSTATGGYWMNQTSNTVSTKRMTNNANDDTVIFPGASGKRITFNNFANTVENVVITDTGLVVTGTLSATDAISTQKDTDAVFRGVAMRNSSTGTSAYTQFAMGDSNSAFNFTITSFGTNFTGLGHYVRIQNQYNAPLQLGGYGDIQLSLTNAGAAVTGTLSATSTVTGMGEIRAYRSENASYYSNLVTNYSDVTTTQITTLGAVKFQAGATDNTNLYSSSAKDIVFFPAATERGRFTSTGLAVTGTLSASGLISAPGMITVNATNASFSGAAIKIKTSDNANTTAITAAGTGLYFSSDGTNTGMFLNSSGLSVTNLLDLSAATAGQIKFPATQNASADANTLDDYEEGTWTPSIGGSATYSNQSGNYIKVGGQVTVTGYLNIASIGSGSTGVISGNPFVAASNSPGSIGYFGNPVTNSIWQTVSADAGGTTFSVFWLAAAGSAPNNASGWFKTGTLTYFSCTYLT